MTSSDLQIVGQVILYHFTLDALATVDIQLTALDFDTYLRLFAGSGVADRTTDNLLLLDDDGGGGTNSRITDALLAGDYLIEVGAFPGAGSGSFDLDLAVSDVDADEDLNGAVAIAADTTSGGLFPAGDTDLLRGNPGPRRRASRHGPGWGTARPGHAALGGRRRRRPR